MSLWLALLVPSRVPGVATGSPTNSSPSSHSSAVVTLNQDSHYIGLVQKSSLLWNALFDDRDGNESGRQLHRNATEEYHSARATRQAPSAGTATEAECAPPPKQLEKLNFNLDDPMIAAALSLSALAEMHARHFTGEPRDRLAYKLRACTRATRMLNKALRPFNRNATGFCRWNYTCSYQPNRFPQYLVQAVCQNSNCHACSPIVSTCLPVRASMEVLRWTCPAPPPEDEADGSGDSAPATGSVWLERIDPTLACRCRVSSYSQYTSVSK